MHVNSKVFNLILKFGSFTHVACDVSCLLEGAFSGDCLVGLKFVINPRIKILLLCL